MRHATTLLVALLTLSVSAQSLQEARKGFVTKPRDSAFQADEPVPEPPPKLYQRIKYTSPAGQLAALLSPDPKDNKRRPAVLWCHGGFGGLGDYYWSPQPAGNDQTPKAFLDAGYVVMLPTWRGENDNPGRYEMFLGEVDDCMAALEHLRKLPYVDPDRVYVVGHSTGGTIALLAALSTDKIRAAFSFGGSPDLREWADDWADMMPFDPKDQNELRVRSATDFIATLKTPTWYIEGQRSGHVEPAQRMRQKASAAGAPLSTAIIKGATHFDILRPVTVLLAERLKEDTGPTFGVNLTAAEFQAAFDGANRARLAKRRNLPMVSLTPAAATAVKAIAAGEKYKPGQWWLDVSPGKLDITESFDPAKQVVHEQRGIRIAVPKAAADAMRGVTIDYVESAAGKGFKFHEPEDP